MIASLPADELFGGGDIAAATATVAWQRAGAPRRRPLTIAQTPADGAALTERLPAPGGAPPRPLIVMEATGSSWITRAPRLHQAD